MCVHACVCVCACAHSLDLCKVNYCHATCKLCVTCEAAAALYGEHSILVQLDLAKHSGSQEERVWLCLREWVCLLDWVFSCAWQRGSNQERAGKLKRGGKKNKNKSQWKGEPLNGSIWLVNISAGGKVSIFSLQGFLRGFPGIIFLGRFYYYFFFSVQIEWQWSFCGGIHWF